MTIDDIIKNKLEKLDKENDVSRKKQIIDSLVLEIKGDYTNLAYIDVDRFIILDDIIPFSISRKIIEKARYLLNYNEADIKNYPQYKQAMEDLNKLYNLLLKAQKSYDKVAIMEKRSDYQKLFGFIHGTSDLLTLEEAINLIEGLKLDYKEENKLLLELTLSEIKKRDVIDLSYLSEEELEVYEMAKEVVEASKEEIYKISKDKMYEGYISMAKQGLMNNILAPNIKTNVELVVLNRYVLDLEETLKLYNSLNDSQKEEKKYLEEQILESISNMREIVIRRNKENNSEDKYQLIFLEDAKKEFHGSNLQYKGFKNQVVSVLSELKKGDFNTQSIITDTSYASYRKKKLNIRVSYIRISDNLFLIVGINNREQLDDNYTMIKNRINGQSLGINQIINMSKTEEGSNYLLDDNKDINEELDALIRKREKLLGGELNER